ncbi:MAG: sulfatase-like hydrolase/transferase [Myxococcales bacterium]|nr:sulfatase-like hydrolase/transferase [Myxococcales bacterium]
MRRRLLDAAIVLTGVALWLWLAERASASVQGVSSIPLSWPARAALLGLHLAAAGAAGLVVGLVSLVQAWVCRRGAAELTAALACGALCLPVGWSLAGGAWISQQWYAPLVAWGPTVAAMLAGALGVVLYRRPGRLAPLGFSALSLAAVLADALVAVGHYVAFHALAYGVAAMAAVVVTVRLVAARARPWPRAAPVVAVLLLGTGSVAWLAMPDSVRAELLLRSPLARSVLRTTRLRSNRLYVELRDLEASPSRASSPPASVEPLAVPAQASIVLLTVDALRADALPPVRAPGRPHARPGDTPNIDALFEQSYVFGRAYAPASYTLRSLPSVFHSRPSFEHPLAPTTSLPAAMAAAGRAPLAVLDRHLTEERDGRALLEPFDAVDAHSTAEIDQSIEQLAALIDQTEGQPFFAWLHVFTTHSPGYAGRPLEGRDGSWPVRYRKSVRYLDREVGRLRAMLDERGLSDSTILVLSSDHGEGLGDNGIALHGETVFEEELRVPLAIHVPGHEGRRIDATVGLVDLLPTLVDLLGSTPDPRYFGRSLVPLLQDPHVPWEHDYFAQSRRDTYAIIRGHHKLMYDAEADTFVRFDLALDPTEDHDLYDPEAELDRRLRSALVRANPALFQRELSDPDTHGLLRQRLRELDPGVADERLAFLLRVVALQPQDDLVDDVLALWRQATDDAVRLQIIVLLLVAAPAQGEAVIAEHLGELAGTASELVFVQDLADHAAPMFAPSLVGERMGWWIEHGQPADWRPWLSLLQPWKDKPAEAFVEPLLAVLGHEPLDADLALAALAATAGLATQQGTGIPALADAVTPYVTHPQHGLRTAACTALIEVGGPAQFDVLRVAASRRGEDLRVRQACLKAAALATGERSVPILIQSARDPLLTFYSIRLMERVGSKAAVPFLEQTIARHKRGRVHAAATSALRRIQRQ